MNTMYSPYAVSASQQYQRLYASAANQGNQQLQNSRYSSDYYDDYDYGYSGYPSYNTRNNLYNNQRQQQLNRNQMNRRMGGSTINNMRAAASHGSYSDDYCDNGISIGLLLTAALGIAVMFYTLYTKITMAGGRRRRKRDQNEEIESFKFGLEHLTDFFYSGLEEFEDKVDKIANGQDDESWIGQLYNQFSTNLGIDGGKIDDEDIGSMDGLEPPIIDEKWGLEDIRKLHEPEEEPRSRSKRDLDQNDVEDTKDDDEDDAWTKTLEGDSKCKARFWKCIGKVATGSLHYMDEPGGVSGAVKKMLFRMAFHGGIGNFWKALMTIPEARDVKRCMNKQDDCMSFEVLRKEVQTLDGETFVSQNDQRLLINPEFVESMDNSDGSEQFSPEDQAIEDREMDNKN